VEAPGGAWPVGDSEAAADATDKQGQKAGAPLQPIPWERAGGSGPRKLLQHHVSNRACVPIVLRDRDRKSVPGEAPGAGWTPDSGLCTGSGDRASKRSCLLNQRPKYCQQQMQTLATCCWGACEQLREEGKSLTGL
jgi:hypothetical protein